VTDNDFTDPDTIKDIIDDSQIIAVVGLSDKPNRASHGVASYLKREGYTVIPVNPNKDIILGEKSYPNLKSIPQPIDLVDIFRRSDAVGPIVDEAISIKAKAVWLQQDVINHDAAKKAADAGLKVVMNRCLFLEHTKLKS